MIPGIQWKGRAGGARGAFVEGGPCSELSWFSPFPLILETKPGLRLHPKFTLMQHKFQKAKNIEFGHEVVPGGFPDSLLLPHIFPGHVRSFLKVFFQIFGRVSAHYSKPSYFAPAKPANQKRGKNHHGGNNICFLLIILEKLYSQPKGGGALNWNHPALRLVCE